MADSTAVHLGENSPEYIAYRLMQDVMRSEKRQNYEDSKGTLADRKYLLDTYAECVMAVRVPHTRLRPSDE